MAEVNTREEKIRDQRSLRAYYGPPNPRAARKQMVQIEEHSRRFIEHSPFCVVASSSAGGTDASPKGDAPGFVKVLDDHTLLIPDRPGNNRVDTFQNIFENPNVGIIFFVPGVNETLRVNGRARLTTDPELLEPLSVRGRMPLSGLIVEIDEVYLHCAKALMRSNLWDPSRHVDRRSFPTMGRMLADQIGGLDPEETQRQVEEGYRDRLY